MRAASAFQRAFFSRRGNRDLFFLASLGIFVDFIRGAGAAAACGGAAFFLAALSAAFASFTEPPSAAFFLSAMMPSRSANLPENPHTRLTSQPDRSVGVHHLCLALAGLETNVSRVAHRRNYPEVGPAVAFEEVWQDCSRDSPVNAFFRQNDSRGRL